MSNRVVNLEGWCIITNMSVGGDYPALCGSAWGHPGMRNGDSAIPGAFVSFDRETMIGVSRSGTHWYLDPKSFCPTGNARTLEDALEFIDQHWMTRD